MELIRRICILFFSAIIVPTFLYGKIEISESVTQFRYPKFSDNGFIEWVLEGNSGNYGHSDISIEGLKLRIYSGDQSARSLSNITGENCIFNSDSQIASSDDDILIRGSGFNLSGNQWTYYLAKEIIYLNSDAFVRFSQNIDSIFSGVKQAGETTITSNQMRLIIEPNRYLFLFEGDCTLSSESFILKAELLKIELLNSSNNINFSVPTGELSGMKSIEGEGDVNFIGLGQFIQSDNFIIIPPENSAIFDGNSLIQYNQITLKGDSIDWKQNKIDILSFNNNLSSFSNSNIGATNSNKDLSSAFIQSRKITLLNQEDAYEYLFNQDVFFVSDLYRINADRLFLNTKETPNHNSSEILQDITLTEANGNVTVKHQDYLISGQYLKFLPLVNQLKLEDEVTYISDFANLKSEQLFLDNDILLASSSDELLEVVLPNTPDLNFEFDETSNVSELASRENTIVYANDLKINNQDSIYKCVFSGTVKLSNSNFSLLSDSLYMNWMPADPVVEENVVYRMNTMVADGSVKMEQMDYYATADHAEILPNEKIFHLFGNAHFKDINGSIWGDRIEFDRRLKQTKVVGSENQERARIKFDLFETKEENLEEYQKE